MNLLSDDIVIKFPEDGDQSQAVYEFLSKADGKPVAVEDSLDKQPLGLRSGAICANIKYPDVYDFSLVALDKPGIAAGVFTRNRSASPAVVIDREHLTSGKGKAQALVVVSKNANVFTPTDHADSMAIINGVSKLLGIADSEVLLSCTGVIGVPMPMDKIAAAIQSISGAMEPGLQPVFAEAILTTDKGPKVGSVQFGGVSLCGVAKGAGMIEPNMATMLVYFFTDLTLEPQQLQDILKRVCDATFNSISVDSDTSTSDSVIIFSTQQKDCTPELLEDFEKALGALALKLSQAIVYQAEGATKLVEVTVKQARSVDHAKRVTKQVINSPLVKTAVFGADPNWGRIVMSIGKPVAEDEGLFDKNRLSITMQDKKMFDGGKAVPLDVAGLSQTIKADKKVDIVVELGEGDAEWTAWGCDLSYRYVEINAEYTT